MPADITTSSFLDICQLPKEVRINKLGENLGLSFPRNERNSIEMILEFIKYIDDNLEKYDPKHKITSMLDEMLYLHIPSDFRSLIILASKKQNYQLNIILRHLLEIFVTSIWADLVSNFTNAFDYLVEDKEWKPYRDSQRVSWDISSNFNLPNRSIRDRLDRIRLLNFRRMKDKQFYKNYFSKCSQCDLYILFQLPICNDCIARYKKHGKKINVRRFHLDDTVLKKGKEDIHAQFKSDFGFECSYCGRSKENRAHTRGIPEAQDMLDMLNIILPDNLLLNISTLRKLYSYLSDEFVHYSTKIDPDRKPPKQEFNNNKLSIWSFQGILFFISMMHPILLFYFQGLKKRVKK